MRIIGGKDYYDSAMAFGHDPHITYVRGDTVVSEEEMTKLGIFRAELPGLIKGNSHKWNDRWHGRCNRAVLMRDRTEHTLTFLTVILAGARYQGLHINTIHSPQHKETTECVWDLDTFKEWMKATGVRWEANDAWWSSRHIQPILTLEDYFRIQELSGTVLTELINRRWTVVVHNPVDPIIGPAAIDTNAPLSTQNYSREHGYSWVVDQPVLRKIEFYRILPPNLAFQEIDMWISGILPAQGNPTVEISDKIRAEKHGMDKTSFRKPPQK